MRIKINDRMIVDYGGNIVAIKLVREDTKWYIIVDPIEPPLFKCHKFLVGDDGDTVFNKNWEIEERVEKIAEGRIDIAFTEGFLDLSDYEEVT